MGQSGADGHFSKAYCASDSGALLELRNELKRLADGLAGSA